MSDQKTTEGPIVQMRRFVEALLRATYGMREFGNVREWLPAPTNHDRDVAALLLTELGALVPSLLEPEPVNKAREIVKGYLVAYREWMTREVWGPNADAPPTTCTHRNDAPRPFGVVTLVMLPDERLADELGEGCRLNMNVCRECFLSFAELGKALEL
jgi:hypothetical protein